MRDVRTLMLLVIGAAVARPAPILAQEARRAEALSWMAGCWEARGRDLVVEEQWMAERGGLLMGMSRTVRANRAVEHEYLRVEERSEALVLVAHPSGQAAAEFAATTVSDSLVRFENPEHDFPQAIQYRIAGDSLHARIEGHTNGQVRSVDFPLRRATCPGSGSP